MRKAKEVIPYTVKHFRSGVNALLLLIAILTIAYPAIKLGIAIAGNNYANRTAVELSNGLNLESNYLTKERNRISSIDSLINAAKNRDIAANNAILDQEKKKITASSIGTTDSSGIVLSRLGTNSRIGDNVFISSAQGRGLVRNGLEEASIELRTVDTSQLSMSSGIFLKDGDTKVGALFLSNTIDDAYVTKLRDNYLSKDVDLAFYTYTSGLAGTSITDENKRNVISTYLHPGSSLLNSSTANTIVSINGKHYFIKTITFPGLEASPGGVVILIPSYDQYESFLVGTFAGTIFLFLALLIHSRRRKEERYQRYLPEIISTSIIIFVLVFLLDSQIGTKVIKLDKPLYGIYNSTLSLVPVSSVFDTSFDQRIDIKIITGGESINSVGAVINFNPQQAQITKIDTSMSFCTLFPTKKIDNTLGQVSISCGLPNPGLTSATGIVAELTLHAVKAGTIALDFDKASQVLANDGLGTDVLRTVTNASYQAIAPTLVVAQAPTIIPLKITVYSPSHSNSEQWYPNRDLKFTWLDNPGYSYYYSLDEIADANPSNATSTDASSIDITVPGDGIFYLHLQPRVAGVTGPLTNYKVMIDSTAPSSPNILASSTQVSTGEVVRFAFDSTDATSGLQKNYYIKVDNNLFLPTATQVYIPFTSIGQHHVTVRIFDNAGNSTDSSITIDVTSQNLTERLAHFFQSFFAWL